MAQEYLTIKEYAKKTGIGESTLYRNFKEGNLKNAVKIGGRIIIVEYIDDKSSEWLIQNKEKVVHAIKQIATGYNELLVILENM